MARRQGQTMRGERDGENEGERQREHMVPKTRESEDERREAHELENFRVDGGVRGAERCHRCRGHELWCANRHHRELCVLSDR